MLVCEENDSQKLKKLSLWALVVESFAIPISQPLAMIAMIVGNIILFIRLKKDKNFTIKKPKMLIPILIFIFFSFVSIFVSPNKVFSFYNWYNLVGSYFFTYFLVLQTIDHESDLRLVMYSLGLSATVVTFYGLYQYVFGIDTSMMKWVDGDAFPELKKRVFSTLENPNILAGYLAEVICVVFAFLVNSRKRKQTFYLGMAMTALLVCLAATYARGAMLSLGMVFLWYGFLKDRRVLGFCIVVGMVIFFFEPTLADRLTSIFVKLDTSAEMRIALWESSIAMIKDHPLWGVGWGAYYMVYHAYDFYINNPEILIVHAHNIYLNYMAEIGILGGCAFFWLFLGNIYDVFKRYSADSSSFQNILRLGIGLALISVALGGLTDDVLFNIPTSMLLWLTFGIIEKSNDR